MLIISQDKRSCNNCMSNKLCVNPDKEIVIDTKGCKVVCNSWNGQVESEIRNIDRKRCK